MRSSFTAIFYFFIAASLGLFLRLFPVIEIDATYRFIVHTHSHIALIGWVYIGLTFLIYHLFSEKSEKNKKKYQHIFWFTQFTIIGMLISFPFQGYALFSILFSTLFLIASYWFYAFFRKTTKKHSNTPAYKFIHTSLLFMIISSIGPWSLGAIMNTLGNSTHWYKNAIYFYLHFQYNGWFVFALLGVFFYVVAQLKISIPNKQLNSFYKLFFTSCLLTFFLSVLWMGPHPLLFIIAGIGAVLQVIALIKFIRIVQQINPSLKQKTNPIVYKSLKLAFLFFLLKITLQTISAIPFFAALIPQILDFVIAYLHLTFLGVVSLALFGFLAHFKLMKLPTVWTHIYVLGFVLSEVLIFYKGVVTWKVLGILDNYYPLLILCSSLMPIGIAGVLIYNIKINYPTQKESL